MTFIQRINSNKLGRRITKTVALAIFDLGHVIMIIGLHAQRATRKEIEFFKWKSKIERRALRESYEE
jgi:hypothetical protein